MNNNGVFTSDFKPPVLPSVVAKVVQLAADSECSIQDLGTAIRSDPVFTGNVLKAVNSPLYGLRSKITSVDHAISFMGIRAIRNLVLCLGIRELSPQSSPYPLKLFWQGCLRRASAAGLLAELVGLQNKDEVFTLGLCQDLGVLVLIQKSEDIAKMLAEVAEKPHYERLSLEREIAQGHDEIAKELFELWGLPENFAQVIGSHHHTETCPSDYRVVCRACSVAEDVADSFLVEDRLTALSRALDGLSELGIDQTALGNLIDNVGRQVQEAAEMLNLNASKEPDYADIVETASQGLLDLNASYEEITGKLKHALEEQRRLAKQLEESNKKLEKLSLTDPLTGLPNRRALDETLDREVAFSARHGVPLCLAMLDIDHFKLFNDEHGHECGDPPLIHVSDLMRSSLRKQDCVARWGGDECRNDFAPCGYGDY